MSTQPVLTSLIGPDDCQELVDNSRFCISDTHCSPDDKRHQKCSKKNRGEKVCPITEKQLRFIRFVWDF